jgi:hypothetical protein
MHLSLNTDSVNGAPNQPAKITSVLSSQLSHNQALLVLSATTITKAGMKNS